MILSIFTIDPGCQPLHHVKWLLTFNIYHDCQPVSYDSGCHHLLYICVLCIVNLNMLSEMKRGGQGQNIKVTCFIIKFSKISKDKHLQKMIYIMLSDRDRTLHSLDLNATADFS